MVASSFVGRRDLRGCGGENAWTNVFGKLFSGGVHETSLSWDDDEDEKRCAWGEKVILVSSIADVGEW